MAGVHTYKQLGKDVAIFAIDHSVGRNATNMKDDVQLIQILINRYIDVEANLVKNHPESGRKGVLDMAGRQIDKLDVDGVCGPLTLAAILATQRALNVWRQITVDGRIDPIKEGGRSQYEDGTVYRDAFKLDGKIIPKIMNTRFNTMFILAVGAEADVDSYDPVRATLHRDSPDYHPLDPIDMYSLPDPLRASLLRASLAAFIGPFVAHGPNR